MVKQVLVVHGDLLHFSTCLYPAALVLLCIPLCYLPVYRIEYFSHVGGTELTIVVYPSSRLKLYLITYFHQLFARVFK